MKFGMTTAQADLTEQLGYIENMLGKTKFAFIPVKMEDGSWLWMEKYIYATECSFRQKDSGLQVFSPWRDMRYPSRSHLKYRVGFVEGSKVPDMYGEDAYNFLIEARAELIAKLYSV